MNILLIDPGSYLLDFSLRASAQGHDVRHWMPVMRNRSPNRTGEGLVKRVRGWETHMRWADLIVLGDNVQWLPTMDRYRRAGFPVFGACAETARWELDRQYGQDILARAGVKVAAATRFDSYRRAAQFVAHDERRYVAKPNGDADRSLSYVSKGQEDMLYMLAHWQRTHPRRPDFVLQEFIPGLEFAVGGFFGPGGWAGYWLENFEHKKLMAGNIGPNTGEMGTAIRYVKSSKLADEMLRPLEPMLFRAGHTGYIDVAVIIDRQGRPWPLEFTSRFGYPLWLIQQVLHPDTANWMRDMTDARDTFEPLTGKTAVGVVIGLRDFPYNHAPQEQADGTPVFGVTDDLVPWLHPDALRMGEALGQPVWTSAGTTPLVVTGRHTTVMGAHAAAYRHIDRLNIPASPMYRNDIAGAALNDTIRALQKHGYAHEWITGDES